MMLDYLQHLDHRYEYHIDRLIEIQTKAVLLLANRSECPLECSSIVRLHEFVEDADANSAHTEGSYQSFIVYVYVYVYVCVCVYDWVLQNLREHELKLHQPSSIHQWEHQNQ